MRGHGLLAEQFAPARSYPAGADSAVCPAFELRTLDVRATPSSRLESFLTADESVSTGTIRHPRAKQLAIASRALVRVLGAVWCGIDPHDVPVRRWCVSCRTAGHGRPYIGHVSAPDFSLAHSGDLVVIAHADTSAIGFDIEAHRNLRDLASLADQTLSEQELGLLTGNPSEKAAMYLSLWTRKEAVLKLTGDGLATSPKTLDVAADVVEVGPAHTRVGLTEVTVEPGYVSHVALADIPSFHSRVVQHQRSVTGEVTAASVPCHGHRSTTVSESHRSES